MYTMFASACVLYDILYIFIYGSSMDHFSRTSGIRNIFYLGSLDLPSYQIFKLFYLSHFYNVNGAGFFGFHVLLNP